MNSSRLCHYSTLQCSVWKPVNHWVWLGATKTSFTKLCTGCIVLTAASEYTPKVQLLGLIFVYWGVIHILKLHIFKMQNAVAVSIFTNLCTCHHCFIPERSHHPEEPQALYQSFSFSFPTLPALGTHSSPVPVNVPILDISLKCKYDICPLVLSFIYYNVFKPYPCHRILIFWILIDVAKSVDKAAVSIFYSHQQAG